MTVLVLLAVREHLPPSSSLSYKTQCQEAAAPAVVEVSVVTANPLKLNPLSWDPPGEAETSSRPFQPGTAKESEKSPKGCPGRLRIRGSPRVPFKECAPESEKSQKGVRSCIFGVFSDSVVHSLGTLGFPRIRRPWDALLDSLRTLLGFQAQRAGRPLCQAGGFPTLFSDILKRYTQKSLFYCRCALGVRIDLTVSVSTRDCCT